MIRSFLSRKVVSIPYLLTMKLFTIISGSNGEDYRKNSSAIITMKSPNLRSQGLHYNSFYSREFTYNLANSNNNSCHAFIINSIRNVLMRMIVLITE